MKKINIQYFGNKLFNILIRRIVLKKEYNEGCRNFQNNKYFKSLYGRENIIDKREKQH